MVRWRKERFAVIGKLGSTSDEAGFIQKLWADANSHFDEVQSLAKRDENGNLCGIWGAMSDFTGSFQPWEDEFTKGLYLAGIECEMSVEAPVGWTKWEIPAYEYLRMENDAPEAFVQGIAYLQANGLTLVGAVQEFTCPQSGKNYLLFPISKL